jgi:Trypsin-co-occurring domain 2
MNPTPETVSIKDLVVSVKSAVKAANISASNANRDLRIAKLELTLHAVTTMDLGGGIEFRLPVIGTPIKIGARTVQQQTHTLHVELAADDLPTYEIRDTGVEEVLVEAIESIRHIMAVADGDDDPMSLRTGSVELVFGVTDQGTVSLGANSELTDEITHTLRLEFERVAH